MSDLLPFLIAGLVTGSLYGLAALGLVLTYRTSGVLNFGHGAIAAAAAYVFSSLYSSFSLPWPIAALLTVVLFGVCVGWMLERITSGLGNVPDAVVVVVTVGVLLLVTGILHIQYGVQARQFPEFLPTSGFTFGGVRITWSQVISVVVASASAVALHVFLRRSPLGVSMRAVVDNPTLVSLAGTRPSRVRTAAWMIGSSFAAVSGMLLAPVLGLDATLLTLLVVQAFGACAIGYFSNLPLTYLGGLAVGVTASFATKIFTDPPLAGIPPAVPFIVLVLVLLAVPKHRLPARRASLHALAAERTPMSRITAIPATVLSVAVLALIPFLVGSRLSLWITGLTYVILFGSLALLVWTSGQISLCQAAFVAIGATTMAHVSGAGIPWALGIPLAGLAAVPVGLLVAVPAIRLSGVYLALATLGFGIFMQNVVYPSFLMFGSQLSVSVRRPSLGALDASSDRQFYFVVLAIAAVVVAGLAFVTRTRLGRLLRGLAETPTVLETHGLDVVVLRLIVFSMSAFLAAVSGALTVTQFGAVNGVSFGPIWSITLLAALAVSGTRPIRGPVFAAGIVAILPGYVSSFDPSRQSIVFGLAAITIGSIIARRHRIELWMKAAAEASTRRLQHGPMARSRMAEQATSNGRRITAVSGDELSTAP